LIKGQPLLIRDLAGILILATILMPLALVGQQEEKHCSDFLYGLYYGSWNDQESDLAFVISSNGQPIPPKANDPGAPTASGFYEGERHFKFASSQFSPQGFSFRTVGIDGKTFSFKGRFGCEEVDVIPEVPYLEGELTEMRNGRVVRRKKVHFVHAVIL
jgi:hypothetical protein